MRLTLIISMIGLMLIMDLTWLLFSRSLSSPSHFIIASMSANSLSMFLFLAAFSSFSRFFSLRGFQNIIKQYQKYLAGL